MEYSGSRLGFGSLIRMVPDRRLAVIILGNKTGMHLEKTTEKAMELVLPLTARNEAKGAVAMSDSEMANYAGLYDNSHKIELYIRDKKLFLRDENIEMAVTKIGR